MAMRVLLVEDEYLIRLWLADCLREAGFDVTEAENGDRALALLDIAEGFDLLITDLHMPGRADGNAVAAGAKLRYPGLPVIYATGRCDTVYEHDDADHGAASAGYRPRSGQRRRSGRRHRLAAAGPRG
jgi:CheY-like chemotaxis protein